MAPARTASAGAQKARILSTITFHFAGSRLGFLAEVLRSLSEYRVAQFDVVLVTNTSDPGEIGLLRRLGNEILSGGGFDIRSYGDLSDPWQLTWCHKEILSREFVNDPQGRYTHFIHLEGDVRISFANFCYFVEFREVLRDFGLLPAFVRVEFSAALGGFVGADVFWPVYVPVQSHLVLGDLVLVNMPNPYNPCFILDHELAEEYVRSRSFDQDGSRTVCSWGLAERAAMGLCLEAVPPPFQSRYVVPVSRQTGTAPGFAWISHLPNSYADNEHSPLAKVRIDALFAGAGELTREGAWQPADATLRWHGTDYCRATDRAESKDEIVDDAAVWSCKARDSGRRYHLISHHDTVVFVDDHAKVLRHAPFGIAPLNLVLELGDQHAHFLQIGPLSSQRHRLSVVSESGEVCVPLAGGDCDYDVEVLADGRIALRVGQHYLSAHYGGVVRGDGPWSRDWENYRLVREDTFAGLLLLRQFSWLNPVDRRIVSLAAQPIDFGHAEPVESSALAATLASGALDRRRQLVFGPARLGLVGRHRTIFVEEVDPDAGGYPAWIGIVDTSGTGHEFMRFTPLVQYDVRGDDECYDRLRVSLRSLERFGRFGGMLGVACDRSEGELLDYIPEVFRSRLMISRAGVPSDCIHQPVLPVSVNAVFDTDITGLLIELLMKGRK
jgi:hypothetical protein